MESNGPNVTPLFEFNDFVLHGPGGIEENLYDSRPADWLRVAELSYAEGQKLRGAEVSSLKSKLGALVKAAELTINDINRHMQDGTWEKCRLCDDNIMGLKVAIESAKGVKG